MKNNLIKMIFLFLVGSSIFYVSCKKKKTTEKIYNESKSTDLTFYKNKDTIYSPAGGSPHGPFKLKFNSIASSSFGADGKLPVGEKFKDGALIVKELWSGNELTLYVVMKKDSKSKFSSAGNWIWAEYKPNGDAAYNITDQGRSCVGCHAITTARDETLSFNLH